MELKLEILSPLVTVIDSHPSGEKYEKYHKRWGKNVIFSSTLRDFLLIPRFKTSFICSLKISIRTFPRYPIPVQIVAELAESLFTAKNSKLRLISKLYQNVSILWKLISRFAFKSIALFDYHVNLNLSQLFPSFNTGHFTISRANFTKKPFHLNRRWRFSSQPKKKKNPSQKTHDPVSRSISRFSVFTSPKREKKILIRQKHHRLLKLTLTISRKRTLCRR